MINSILDIWVGFIVHFDLASYLVGGGVAISLMVILFIFANR